MEGQAQEALLPAEGDEGGEVEESPEALAVAQHLDVPILFHHEQAVVARRGGREDGWVKPAATSTRARSRSSRGTGAGLVVVTVLLVVGSAVVVAAGAVVEDEAAAVVVAPAPPVPPGAVVNSGREVAAVPGLEQAAAVRARARRVVRSVRRIGGRVGSPPS